jgi:hypothetical protein
LTAKEKYKAFSVPEEIYFLGRKNKGFCRRQKSSIFDSSVTVKIHSWQTQVFVASKTFSF